MGGPGVGGGGSTPKNSGFFHKSFWGDGGGCFPKNLVWGKGGAFFFFLLFQIGFFPRGGGLYKSDSKAIYLEGGSLGGTPPPPPPKHHPNNNTKTIKQRGGGEDRGGGQFGFSIPPNKHFLFCRGKGVWKKGKPPPPPKRGGDPKTTPTGEATKKKKTKPKTGGGGGGGAQRLYFSAGFSCAALAREKSPTEKPKVFLFGQRADGDERGDFFFWGKKQRVFSSGGGGKKGRTGAGGKAKLNSKAPNPPTPKTYHKAKFHQQKKDASPITRLFEKAFVGGRCGQCANAGVLGGALFRLQGDLERGQKAPKRMGFRR